MTYPFHSYEVDESDRAERLRLKEEEKYWQPVEDSHYQTELNGQGTSKAYHDHEQAWNALREHEAANEHWADATTEQQVGPLRFCLFLLAAYIISLVLIYESTSYLVSLVVTSNGLLQMVGILLMPLALIIMQLSIAIDVHQSQKDTQSVGNDKRNIAKVAVLITPMMILGTFLAEATSAGFWLPEVLLLLVRMALAYITDKYIVENGVQAQSAKVFFLFKIKQYRLRARLERETSYMEAYAGQTIVSFRSLQKNLTTFRQRFPDATRPLPAFSNATKWVLERWIGDDYSHSL